MKPNSKLVIIGAGPAGCTCAIRLAQHGFKNVRIVARKRGHQFEIGESVPGQITPLLRTLGVYSKFMEGAHEPSYGARSYWGSDLPGYNDSILNPHGHGWHLDRARFNQMLLEEAVQLGTQLYDTHTFLQYEEDAGILHIRDEVNGNIRILEADFIIDASGKRSIFSQTQKDHNLLQEDQPLICLSARLQADAQQLPPQQTHLESAPMGWWYATRLPQHQLLVALFTTALVSKYHALNNFDTWKENLAPTHTQQWLQTTPHWKDNTLRAFSAPSFCLHKITGKYWMAIGDAAATYDPITSQGILKAMTQAVQAADLLANAADPAPSLNLFEQQVQHQYQHYRQVRQYFYNLEKRWPDALFWQQMAGGQPSAVSGQWSAVNSQ